MRPNKAIVEGAQKDIQRRKEAKKDQKDQAHAAWMKRAKSDKAAQRQAVIAEISYRKNTLFKDPKLSDQALALEKEKIQQLEKQLGQSRFSSVDTAKELAHLMDLPTNVPRTKDVFSANVRAKEGGRVKGRG